ncbi:MAG: DUF937 domain-containing protein [Methylococcaceae bacterium]|nr:DUF937 domain-containing protein [Methylococcaceae bacterium]
MGILDVILGGQNTQLISQLAQKSGIGEADVQNVINQLLPAVSKGIKANVGSSEGLGGLISALSSGDHQQYLDNPEKLSDPEAVDEGNAILGHVFGNKDVSRNVADQAAQASGVDSGIVKMLLPLVATTVMGALSKETANNPSLGSGGLDVNNLLGGDSSPVSSLITSFLDADGDGDVTDDLLNMAKKFF